MTYDEVIEELKRLRKERKLSLRKVGAGIGVTGQQMFAIEHRQTQLKLNDFLLYCKVLSINPKDILEKCRPKGERYYVAQQLNDLSERDFRIIKDLILLMSLQTEDL